MKILNCFYDMAVSPCSYDFFTFLYSAEICRVRRGLDSIKLVIVHGTSNYFREDNLRSLEQNKTFFENVIIPGISLLPQCESFMWMKREELNLTAVDATYIFPRGYQPNKPVAEYIPGELIAAQIRQDKPSFLQAPAYAKKLVENYVSEISDKKPIVVLSLRELSRDNTNGTRNIKTNEWASALRKLSDRYTPLIIRDTSKAHEKELIEGIKECPQAAIHLPFRMALYNHAHLNFTKNTGPSLLLLYGETNTIFISKYDEQVPAVSERWFRENFGMVGESQYPMTTVSKKFYWGEEESAKIIDLCNSQTGKNKYSLHLNKFSNSENAKSSIIAALRHLVKVLQHNLMVEDVLLYKHLEKQNDIYKVFDDIRLELIKLEDNIIPKNTVSTLSREALKYS